MEEIVTPLVYVLAFIAVVLAVQTVASLVFASREKNKRVNRRLTMLDSGMSHEEVYSTLVRSETGHAPARLAGIEKTLSAQLRQADMSISASRLMLVVALAAAGLWLFSLLLLRSAEGNFILNAIASAIAAIGLSVGGAYTVVNGKRTKRLKKIEEQLPMALDIIIRAVRAGHPVISAVQLAAQEMGDPIGTEFGLIVDETTYGLEFKDALFNFANRTGSRDAAFFAVSVSIQAQTGGNLAEILDGLAHVIRGRITLAQRVKALASEGKASAYLLSALPMFLVGFFLLFQPQYYLSKFGDVTFWTVIAVVGILYFIGILMMRRIVNFKY